MTMTVVIGRATFFIIMILLLIMSYLVAVLRVSIITEGRDVFLRSFIERVVFFILPPTGRFKNIITLHVGVRPTCRLSLPFHPVAIGK